jgi:hypothetical protein
MVDRLQERDHNRLFGTCLNITKAIQRGIYSFVETRIGQAIVVLSVFWTINTLIRTGGHIVSPHSTTGISSLTAVSRGWTV